VDFGESIWLVEVAADLDNDGVLSSSESCVSKILCCAALVVRVSAVPVLRDLLLSGMPYVRIIRSINSEESLEDITVQVTGWLLSRVIRHEVDDELVDCRSNKSREGSRKEVWIVLDRILMNFLVMCTTSRVKLSVMA